MINLWASNINELDRLILLHDIQYKQYIEYRKRVQENTEKLLQLAKIYFKEHQNFKISISIIKYDTNQAKDWEELRIEVEHPTLPITIRFTSVTCPELTQKKMWVVNFVGISSVSLIGLSFSNLDNTNLFLLYITKAKTLDEVPTYVEKYREKISYLNDF